MRESLHSSMRAAVAVCLVLAAATLVLLHTTDAAADRSGGNIMPARVFERKGEFRLAAVYYDRGLRGLNTVYIPFHWSNDPANEAGGKYAQEYVEMPRAMAEHYKLCVEKAGMTPAEVKKLEALNALWLEELVEFEAGGLRQCCIFTAPESEMCGYFRLGEFLRKGEARFYRVVSIPYHQKLVDALEAEGNKALAALHREKIITYERRAALANRIAAGDAILAQVPNLAGPTPASLQLQAPPEKIIPIAYQYLPGRLIPGKHSQAAKMLKAEGPKQTKAAARFSLVHVLANLGEKESLAAILNDASPEVRRAAAERLAGIGWAEGWAACARHADAAVRDAVKDIAAPARPVVLKTRVVTELFAGLKSPTSETRAYCEGALRSITGETLAGRDAWTAWWNRQGNLQPGLVRTGPGNPPAVDPVVDFGTWWQFWFRAEHPLRSYKEPATVVWEGKLAVPAKGTYTFYSRNCGQSRSDENKLPEGGFFPRQCVTLVIDGKTLIPGASEAVEDSIGTRIDIGTPVALDAGLHAIRLEFHWRGPMPSPRDGGRTGGQPEIRLYWSSDRFLRELVGADHLLHAE